LLARELCVSRNVVVDAFAQLRSEGYIEGRLGSGTYVSAMLPEPGTVLDRDRAPTPTQPIELKLSRYAREVLSTTTSSHRRAAA
jgi:GntR family transcriptional regulator/MocR family aminotransferase